MAKNQSNDIPTGCTTDVGSWATEMVWTCRWSEAPTREGPECEWPMWGLPECQGELGLPRML